MDSLTSYQYITCIDQLARTLFFSPAALHRTATPYKCDPRFKGIWKGSSRATPWSSAECRRRTRCHARGFARARTRARSCAPPRPALSPTGLARIPDRPPMRAGSDSMLGPTLGGTRIFVRPSRSRARYSRSRHEPSAGVEPPSARPRANSRL